MTLVLGPHIPYCNTEAYSEYSPTHCNGLTDVHIPNRKRFLFNLHVKGSAERTLATPRIGDWVGPQIQYER
jgi:hypothetical protein